MILHSARFDELDIGTLYAILRLRVEVFVVEQQCAYPEVDGRDVEATTVHFWFADDTGTPVAYLRTLRQSDGGARIGRVCTAEAARGQGLSARLMEAALTQLGPDTQCELNAQAYLTTFYERFGFVQSGPEFLDDGIPHTPMRREPPTKAEA